MKTKLTLMMAAALMACPGVAHAQRGGRTINFPVSRGGPPTPPLPPLILLERYRAIVALASAALPPTNMTFSLNQRPAGGHIDLFSANASTLNDWVAFASGGDGLFAMTFPKGTQGRFFFDCSLRYSSKVQWLLGETLAVQSADVPVTDGHALFVVDVPLNHKVGIVPEGDGSGSTIILQKCEIRRLS